MFQHTGMMNVPPDENLENIFPGLCHVVQVPCKHSPNSLGICLDILDL